MKKRLYETIDTNIDFNKLYDGSVYTIIGCGGDLQEWIDGYTDMLEEQGIGTPKEWYSFKGKDLNTEYNLSGNNRFSNDLQFLAFPLTGLNIGKLAMFKLRMRDRWFDDLIDNSMD